jgi:nucleotide-binding universal stress UspA family protein
MASGANAGNGAKHDELVVVGVDGSPGSIGALRWAAEYGEATGATIRAVRAWHYPAAVTPALSGRTPAPITQNVEQEMLDQLRATVTQVYPDGLPPNVQTKTAYGHSAEALIEQSEDADLLVVGSKGRGAFTGMLVGSVSIHCVTSAACPVLVVRGK